VVVVIRHEGIEKRSRSVRPSGCELWRRNAKLKRLLADAMLDNAALKDLLGKKW
jgi:hypothetical protein